MSIRPIPVIDLFAGPGGLGEGFSSVRDAAGRPVFDVALSIEKDPFAVQTLRLRTFFRSFEEAPDEYYAVAGARPDDQAVAIEQLFERYRDAADTARRQVLPATLGVTRWRSVYDAIDDALQDVGVSDPWVLIGGPPCQAYSLVGRARMRGKVESPQRARLHRLYKVYLRLLDRYRPPVFVMENVKGLLSARVDGRPIFERILQRLQNPGGGTSRYVIQPFVLSQRTPTPGLLFETRRTEAPDHRSFIIRAEHFGVPQARHRVILLGLRADVFRTTQSGLPGLSEHPVRVGIVEAIGDLPRLRSGVSKSADERAGWRDLITAIPQAAWVAWLRRNGAGDVADAVVRAARRMLDEHLDRRSADPDGGPSVPAYRPDWFVDLRMPGVCNHETRAHIPRDLERYLFAACYATARHRSPKLADFPPGLHPEHSNIDRAVSEGLFGDRFKVQIASDADGRPVPATTITSHISKDGHYYIHYDASQCRSLTVREAARIQTFPDNYVFVGPRTEQYRQVGNAVPPLLALQIGETVAKILSPDLNVRETRAMQSALPERPPVRVR